jgi:hypothetical protein
MASLLSFLSKYNIHGKVAPGFHGGMPTVSSYRTLVASQQKV